MDGFPALAVLAARSPLYARCRAERGTCRLRTGDADAALKDCAAALYVVDDLVDAHLCRANALRALGRHAEARKHLKDIIDESWGGSDVRVKHAFEQADFDLRRTKRPDYYALLNCRQVSSEREIKGPHLSRNCRPLRHRRGDTGRFAHRCVPRPVVTTSSRPPLNSLSRSPESRGRGLQAAWRSIGHPRRPPEARTLRQGLRQRSYPREARGSQACEQQPLVQRRRLRRLRLILVPSFE